ncbi:MAG: ABC transporter substrate-binding protein [Treponema sp.]|nr:ABC transporter substrate-binding protein [Treponema sp.]
MKRFVSVFCIATLLACSIPSAYAKPKTVKLTFWSLFTGGDGEFFNAMIDEFNRTHADIQLKSDPAKYTDYYTKLTTSLASKNAPDIVVVHRDNMLPYVKSGLLHPLDDVLKTIQAPLGDYVAAPLNACRFDGKLYSLPLDVHPIIMYYNKDVLAKAGIAKIPQTFDELIAAAKTVQEKTGAIGLGIDNTTATYKAYTLTRAFISGMGQRGGSVLTADCKKAAFNNSNGIAVIQSLIDAANKHGVTPKGYDYDSAMTDFRLGKTAFYFNGVWATGVFEGQKGLNFAAVPFPPLWGKAGAWAGSHTLAIPVQKKMSQEKIEAAAQFIVWMTQHGEMWAKAGHIPTMVSVRSKSSFTSLPYRADYATAAESVIAAPNTPAWQEIYDNLSDLLEAAVAQNQTGVQAAAAMEKKVNEILAGY